MLLNKWMSDCKQAVLEWEHDVLSTTGRLNVWSVLVCCTWYLEHLLLCWWPILHFSKAAEVSLTISFIWFKLHLVINHFHWCVAVAKKALLYSSSKGVSTTRQQSTERKYMFTAYCLGRQLGNSSRETGGLSSEMKLWMNLPFWHVWCLTLPDFCFPLCFFLYPPATILCYFLKWFLQRSALEAQPAPGLDIPQGISHKWAEQEGCCGLSVPPWCRCALFN